MEQDGRRALLLSKVTFFLVITESVLLNSYILNVFAYKLLLLFGIINIFLSLESICM